MSKYNLKGWRGGGPQGIEVEGAGLGVEKKEKLCLFKETFNERNFWDGMVGA